MQVTIKYGGESVPGIAEAREAIAAVVAGYVPGDLESSGLDFKTVGRSRNDALEDLADAMACFANAAGGTVVVGVADSTMGPAALVGCDLEPERTKHRIFELTNPGLVVSAEVLVVEGVRVLVLSTPSSPTVHAVRGRSHERIGTSCMTMSPERIAAVIADRRGDDWSAEDSGTSLDHVDPVAMAQCRAFLAAHPDRTSRGYAEEADRDVLRLLGVVTSRHTLTNAGALLFTGRLDHRDQISYVFRRTPTGALVTNENLQAPLLTALRRVFDMIDGRLDRTSVNLPGGQQLQLADLPSAAVREAVVNAVMHRDYRRLDRTVIDHAPTRLAVTSPGDFVTGVTAQNILTTSSRTRNPQLASAIRTVGLAETAGTGVDRMYAEMARLGHQPPTFESDLSSVRVTLLGGAPNSHMARFVATLPQHDADDADTMIVLLTLLTHAKVTAGGIAPLLQRPVDETQSVLDRLSSAPVELVERTRQSIRWTHPEYRLREHAVAALGAVLTYRRRTADESDRKVLALVAESGEISARVVRLMLDLDPSSTSRLLANMVARGLLVKTSLAERGRNVTYGKGPGFPTAKRTPTRASSVQPSNVGTQLDDDRPSLT